MGKVIQPVETLFSDFILFSPCYFRDICKLNAKVDSCELTCAHEDFFSSYRLPQRVPSTTDKQLIENGLKSFLEAKKY